MLKGLSRVSWNLAMISVGILLVLLDGVGLVSRPITTLVPAMLPCAFLLIIRRSQAAIRHCPRRRFACMGRGLSHPTARVVTLGFET